MKLQELIKKKILILDGAMGTMIQRYNLTEMDYRGDEWCDSEMSLKGNNDLLNLTQPEIIQDIHLKYLLAGADILETNTFNANRISLTDYKMGTPDMVQRINIAAVENAKKAREIYYGTIKVRPIFIAGAIGPTNKTATISPDVNDPGFREVDFEYLVNIYKEQAKGLILGGADIILVETIFDTLNAKAAFFGIQETFDTLDVELPLMASGTITDRSGRTLSGQTTEAFMASLSHVPLFSIGLNCALGAEELKPYLEIMSKNSSIYVSAYPNAGLPNAFGEYDETPEMMGEHLKTFLEEGLVNIIGGCCGTTPDYTKEMTQLVGNYLPREI